MKEVKHLALTAVILLLIFVVSFVYYRKTSVSYITVTGSSQESQQNEVANFTVSVNATDEDKEVVNEEISTKSEAIVDAVKAFGIEDDNIQTSRVNLYQMEEPRLEDGVTRYEPGDWRASVSIDVKLEDGSRAEAFTQLVSSLDISDFYGPNFSIDTDNIDEKTLLDSAYQDALSKAASMAASLGKSVDKVISIQEAGASTPNYGVFEARGMGGGGGASIPMQPGSTEVSKSVSVTFTLR